MLKKIRKTVLFATLLTLPVMSTAVMSGCTSEPLHESAGQYIDSSVITTKVKAKLLADKEISSLPITVKTYKNVVQLSGFVNSYAEEVRAVSLAQTVPGVAHVDDALTVKHR